MRILDVAVEHVMTLNPAFIADDATLQEAAGLMVDGGFRHLPVVDADRHVIGVLSERELRGKLGVEVERFPEAGSDILEERVEALMRPDPITVGAKVRLGEVMAILEDERIGAIPVVDGAERLVGIVSYVDVLRFVRDQDPRSSERMASSASVRG